MKDDIHTTHDRECFERAIKRAKYCGAYTTFDTIVFLEKEIDSYRDTIKKMKTIPNAARIAAVKAKPKKELKPLNTKIFVLDGDDTLKSSHIYEVKNGKIRAFIGNYPTEGILYNMDDVVNYLKPQLLRNGDENYDSNGVKFSVYDNMKQITVMEVKEG